MNEWMNACFKLIFILQINICLNELIIYVCLKQKFKFLIKCLNSKFLGPTHLHQQKNKDIMCWLNKSFWCMPKWFNLKVFIIFYFIHNSNIIGKSLYTNLSWILMTFMLIVFFPVFLAGNIVFFCSFPYDCVAKPDTVVK